MLDAPAIYKKFKLENYDSGLLFDSKLHGQYHVSAFILAASIYETCEYKKSDIISDCLKRLRQIFCDMSSWHSIDFTIENICLAHYSLRSETLKKKLGLFLTAFHAQMETEIQAKATDYYLLRYFNISYQNKFLLSEISIPKNVSKVVSSVVSTSGILFDSFTKQYGNPDLAYHFRNLQILSGIDAICGNKTFRNVLIDSLKFCSGFAPDRGSFCIYGRSGHLIYGDASLYMAVTILQKHLSKPMLSKIKSQVLDSYVNYTTNSLRLVAGTDNLDNNGGRDSYVFPLVYKSFALSRLAFADWYNNSISQITSSSHVKHSKFEFCDLSGFVSMRNLHNQVITNVIGHPKAAIRRDDTRYLPLYPLFHSSGRVPPLTYYKSMRRPGETFFGRVYGKVFDKIKGHNNTRLNQAYIPIFEYLHERFIVTKYTVDCFSNKEITLQSNKYSSKTSKSIPKELLDIRATVNCNNNLKISYLFNDRLGVVIRLSAFINDTIEFEGNKLFIQGRRILRLNRDVRNFTEVTTKFDSVLGKIKMYEISFVKGISNLEIEYY